jgi:hypothetical protein
MKPEYVAASKTNGRRCVAAANPASDHPPRSLSLWPQIELGA